MAIRPYFVLLRPANLVTAVADILAGASIAGMPFSMHIFSTYNSLFYLILATLGLYGGGVVLNDVFDLKTDQKERPERPIPSNQVSKRNAIIFAIVLFLEGVIMSFLHSLQSGIIALLIVIFATSYDKWAKHHIFFGPLFMGSCRGLNLLLGMSLITGGLNIYWPMFFIPLIFIGAITLTSQGEVIGNNKKAIILALMLDTLVACILLFLAITKQIDLLPLIPFLLLWWGMNFLAKIRAIRSNQSHNIMRAVKIGVLSLIPLNACYAAGFSSWEMGLIILCLLPISIVLSKHFAVT